MSDPLQYFLAEVVSAPKLPLPDDRHSAFEIKGWQAFAVGPASSGVSTILQWPSVGDVLPPRDLSQASFRFRATVAVDHHREDVLIEAYVLGSERVVGRLDVRFPTVCQPLEIVLSPEDFREVVHHGLGLRMVQGQEPVWFVTSDQGRIDQARTEEKHRPGVPDPLMPHLMIASNANPQSQFMNRMLSTASIQPFGWMEGAVLDGLYDLEQAAPSLGAGAVIDEHLRHFFDEDGRLNYVTSTSQRFERIYGIEGMLPLAVVSRVWPDHPIVDEAIAFFETRHDDQGVIGGPRLTSEGCYTVAYPLAVLGNTQSREDFHRWVTTELNVRAQAMFPGDHFYPQVRPNGVRPFQNWGRGCVWFLLGHVRTMAVLLAGGTRPDPSLYDTCARFTEWIVAQQAEDGTWPVYVDDPGSGCDTSATAGLGAAIAWGVVADVLPDSYIARAYQALNGLLPYLTPDGFLDHSAPENKGAESLERRENMQRVAPRGISQMSMGLMLQLIAALRIYEQQGSQPPVESPVPAFFAGV